MMPKFIILTLFAGIVLFTGASVFEANFKIPNPATKNISETSAPTSLNNSTVGAFTNLLLDHGTNKTLRGEDNDEIHILFLGIGGEEHISGEYLTDTIILVSFVPSAKKAAVISIPRDLLVRSPRNGYFTKINALYASDQSGQGFPGPMDIEFSKEKIQEITGLDIHYYAVLDLAGIEKIVDTLGGIYVRRDKDIVDNLFPDDNYGYETYKINEGWRYFSGKDAAKYIRTRHTAGGDFDRMKRQQEVARAIKKKAEGLKSVAGLPKLLSLYKTLKAHLATDLEMGEISRLLELGEGLKEEGIIFEQITAEADGLLVYDRIELGGMPASVLKPRAGLENYSEIKMEIDSIVKKLKIENEKTRSKI